MCFVDNRVDEQSVTQFQMLGILSALGRKGQGRGQGCVITATTIKGASCGQKLLKLLDGRVVPTRGKRQHLQRCCILNCQWDVLNMKNNPGCDLLSSVEPLTPLLRMHYLQIK